VQVAGSGALLNRPRGQPERAQLIKPKDRVLGQSQRHNLGFQSSRAEKALVFFVYSANPGETGLPERIRSLSPTHAPYRLSNRVTCLRRRVAIERNLPR
jgi:hypothetical protein